MTDWLTLWGVSATFGLIFRPILEDLAKGAVDDFAKGVLSDALKNVLGLEKDPLRNELSIATGRAIKEFLHLFQQELENSDVDEREITDLTKPLKLFLHETGVKVALGAPFRPEGSTPTGSVLAAAWRALEPSPPTLPAGFDWNRIARLYVKRVRALREASPILRELLASEDRAAIRAALEVTAGLQPGFNLRVYREAVRERYGRLKLESLDTDGYAYDNLTLWRMYVPQLARESIEFLPRLFELPKEHLRRLREDRLIGEELNLDLLEERRRAFLDQTPRSILDIVADPDSPRLVVLGDPGSGKSSLLQYLVLRWCEASTTEIDLPVLVELREYARQRVEGRVRSFLDFLHSGAGLSYRLDHRELAVRLRDGHAMLFLDGLDEIFDPALRTEVAGEIHHFSKDYPEARLVVTSRVVGYSFQPLRDAGFRHVILQDLDAEQISDFLNRWHRATYSDPLESDRRRTSLSAAITDSQAIRELAGNPLLLTMMAILNRHQDLPRSRADLYEQCSRLLLQQWKTDQTLRDILERSLHAADPRLSGVTLDLKDKQALLRLVAREMQTAAPGGLAGNVIDGDRLKEVLRSALHDQLPAGSRAAAGALIDQLRERNFILCFLGADSYAFVHRTFLEFFCAWDLVWRFEKERTLSMEELTTFFGEHYLEEVWHEVLTLVAGMLSPRFVAKIVDFLLDHTDDKKTFDNVLLAGRCASEVRNRADFGVNCETRLRQSLENLLLFKTYSISSSDYGEFRRIAKIQLRAVSLVAAIWRDRAWLQTLIEKSRNEDIRLAAVDALSRGWKDFESLRTIRNCAISDHHQSVRRTAIEALSRGWKAAPETHQFILERITKETSTEVQRAAVEAYAQCAGSDSVGVATLLEFSRNHENWVVRRTSVGALARIREKDSNTLSIIRDCAMNDEDWAVRKEALLLLSRERGEWVLEFLIDRVRKEDSPARSYILEKLFRTWKDHPAVHHLFAELAGGLRARMGRRQ